LPISDALERIAGPTPIARTLARSTSRLALRTTAADELA
jgi:hypothetical protein